MWFRDDSAKTNRTRANRRTRVSRDPLLMVNARAQDQSRARVRRVRAITVLLVALTGCAAAGYFGGQWVYEQLFTYNPLFTVQVLDIRTDGVLQPADIRAHYHLQQGMNLFAVELRALHGYLMKTPEVRSVDIQRQLPGTLTIRINERQAIARLMNPPQVLDREGHVFRFNSTMEKLPLIIGCSVPGMPASGRITDQPVLDALTMLELCARPRWSTVRPQSIDVAHPEYLELRLAGGERIWLGRSRLEERLDKLAAILKTQAERGQPITFLDLTVDRNIPVQVSLPAGAEGWR